MQVPSKGGGTFLSVESCFLLVSETGFRVHFGAMMTRAASIRSFLFSVSTLRVGALFVGVLAIGWICTFKIMDRDFWWHIKAGEIFLQTGRMIVTDPFAYAREGMAYLATHEWLAQIMLYLVYASGGFTGIILFRAVIATVSVGLLLLLAKKPRIVYTVLAVWAIVITKGSFLERPQLFTFVLFAAFILLAFRFLDAGSERIRRSICAGFIALEILWVNMHGGAALLGCAIVTFLLLQTTTDIFLLRQRESLRTALLLIGTLVLMAIALVLPPNGFGTIHYIIQLMSDQTIAFIAEWQPRNWGLYLSELWPFFVMGVLALCMGRRHWVFNTLLLLATAYLSRQAFRHEILFIFASIATCFYQLERSERMERVWEWIAARRTSVRIIAAIVLLLLARHAYTRSFGFERQDNLFGFGQFDLARGAYDFIEREKITGNMFNTYGIGGYLIYRGYPDRKVFIDGRNVDYGFDYMARAYAAGVNPERWKELTDTYNITYAIVDYDAIKQADRLPYSFHLDTNPEWVPVYVDDWTAVYLKRTPDNQPLIDRLHYTYVDPTNLQFHDDFPEATGIAREQLVTELRRVQTDNPQGIKATMALAKMALTDGQLDEAKTLVERARKMQPYNPEPLAILAVIYTRQEQWQQAADTYSEVLRLAGDNYPNINYTYIASIFQKAGRPWTAWYYRLGSAKEAPVVPAQMSGSSIPAADSKGLSVNPAADALELADLGVAQAGSGQLIEAEQSFRTSLMINPGNPATWNNLCALLISLKRYPEAADACKRAVEIDEKFGDAHYNLALAYYWSGSKKDAEAEALLAKKHGRKEESDALLVLIRKMKP